MSSSEKVDDASPVWSAPLLLAAETRGGGCACRTVLIGSPIQAWRLLSTGHGESEDCREPGRVDGERPGPEPGIGARDTSKEALDYSLGSISPA